MFRLLLCLLLLIPLPVSAGIFDLPRSQPALFNAPLNNSQDFLPVDLAFGLDLIEADIDSIRLRFINADGYYLYKDGFAFGQPLLLDWYADWCISCKVIEREILEVPSVREQLADYRLVRFDMTRSDAEQRALLDRYKLFSPPVCNCLPPVVMSGRTFARLVKPTPRVFWNDCV